MASKKSEDYIPLKNGANVSDIREIRRLYQEKKTAEQISKTLRICLECVESFSPENEAKREKEEAARKAAAEKEREANSKRFLG